MQNGGHIFTQHRYRKKRKNKDVEEVNMKKAEQLKELNIGQHIIVIEDDRKQEYVIRSLEDKLVPYIVATDNSSHSLNKGIWIKETYKKALLPLD